MQIITGPTSIKNIFKDNRFSFVKQFGPLIRDQCYKSVADMLNCKELTSGFATFTCNNCSQVKKVAFTCKSRFCNSCGKPQSDLWMNNLLSWRPPNLHYYHLAFTIPEELRGFFKRHRVALKLLPQIASQAIFYFFSTKHKSTPGILSVIHTFGAKLNRNPHVHLIVTSGGITKQGTYKLVDFIPYKLILPSRKKYLIKSLKQRTYQNVPNPHSEITLLNSLFSQKNENNEEKSRYIYFSKKAQSFQVVLSYIGRYLKRPTISQSRILAYDGNSVTFQYKDKYDNQDKTITCSAIEFIGFLIQHIPNKYFHMIYYHGIFANRCKKKHLLIIHTYYNTNTRMPFFATSYSQRLYHFTGQDCHYCSCGGHFSLYSLSFPSGFTKYFNTS